MLYHEFVKVFLTTREKCLQDSPKYESKDTYSGYKTCHK